SMIAGDSRQDLGKIMPTIRIYLAGRVRVAVDAAGAIHERQFRDRQERRAFTYLASHRDRPVPRGELTQIIWPDEPPLAGEAASNATISWFHFLVAQTYLNTLGISISSSYGQDQLPTPTDTWVDLEVSAAAIAAAEGALRANDPLRAFGFVGVTSA